MGKLGAALVNIITDFTSGAANKTVVTAAAALVNGVESGHWTSPQSVVGYAATVLVYFIGNMTKVKS